MISRLEQWACDRGYRIACGRASVLNDVRQEFQQRAAELDANFSAKYLGFFRYEQSSEAMTSPTAVIVVAVPRPAHRLKFEFESGPFEVTLPPTYVRYQAFFRETRDALTASFDELKGHVDILLAPLKQVASRLGLVAYGRNNVTYIPEFGSYFQLVGFITDIDLGVSHDWVSAPVRMMPDCEGCPICACVCPTGAISDDRFLLHAEACTTLMSEQAGRLEHDLSADCLFGCLECQQACPMNSERLRVEDAGVCFDKTESEAIVRGFDAMPDSVTRKVATLGLTEASLIPRNLSRLLRQHAGTA